MDIAVFVGFAASGPVDVPVAVESEVEFRAIFGEEVPLAWDSQSGEQRYGFLAPTLKAFFRNGGERCWIVRVTGEAKRNYVPVPGLLMMPTGRNGSALAAPAFARARSVGSQADSFELHATIMSQLLSVCTISMSGRGEFIVHRDADATPILAPGDLLRFTFEEEDAVLFTTVTHAKSDDQKTRQLPPDTERTIDVLVGQPIWMRTNFISSPPGSQNPATANVFTRLGTSHIWPSVSPHDETTFMGQPIPALVLWQAESRDGGITVNLDMPFDEAPKEGELVRVTVDEREIWLSTEQVERIETEDSPAGEGVSISGPAMEQLLDPPTTVDAGLRSGGLAPIRSERLRLDFRVTDNRQQSWELSNLGLTSLHPRFWDALPSDEERYADILPWENANKEIPLKDRWADLWKESRSGIFPLAGSRQKNVVYLPFVSSGLTQRTKPIVPDEEALERDGLKEFDTDMFLDSKLKDASVQSLMAQAGQLQFLSATTQHLKGIHAALPIEEASLIAVPDAVHLRWIPSTVITLAGDVPISDPPIRPEWWHFMPCDRPQEFKAVENPQAGHFLACEAEVPSAPRLEGDDEQSGPIQLFWSSSDLNDAYVLEESVTPDFRDAVKVYRGQEAGVTLYGRLQPFYYFRLRVESSGRISNWSNTVSISTGPKRAYELDREALRARELGEGSVDAPELKEPLASLHEALMRMCAARGDLFAVLSVPNWYREKDAQEHASRLVNQGRCSSNESALSSYVALYYPWVVTQSGDLFSNLRNIPPDGTVCGMIAASALTCGSWVAPANRNLRDVLALTPPVDEAKEIELYQAHVNLLIQQSNGFAVFSEATLSHDVELRLINVRRLLMLLRRLAERVGTRYVFEPHNEVFRRSVERGFEQVCEDLFERGAFSGATKATSYQVVVGESINPTQSVDQGRLFVEIRVAPSEPLRFLTVRLVEAGDRGFIVVGR